MINMKIITIGQGRKKNRPAKSCASFKVDNEIIKHIIGGSTTLITADDTNGHNNATKESITSRHPVVRR